MIGISLAEMIGFWAFILLYGGIIIIGIPLIIFLKIKEIKKKIGENIMSRIGDFLDNTAFYLLLIGFIICFIYIGYLIGER